MVKAARCGFDLSPQSGTWPAALDAAQATGLQIGLVDRLALG